ncbi:MAG: GGDEF domain-containing protein [Qipengyuania sp.]|nr:GGDEF domain-containing protein [Qipengyuania sp.]
MGVKRLFLWAAFALAAALAGFAVAGSAAARPIALAGATCAGGADSAEAAFGIADARLDCGAGRFNRRDRFVRGRIDLSKIGHLHPGQLVWQTDPTAFDSMLIRLDYADGSQRLVDVDSQMAVRNWDANGNFWVPIQQEASALTAIDVVVERPQSAAVFLRMQLSSHGEAAGRNYSRILLYMLICGTLLVPIVYDLLFYRVLRARFMIWHLGMTVGTLLYVLFNSGLIMVIWPDIPSRLRFAALFFAMSVTVLCMAQFSLQVLEEGLISRPLRRALLWSAAVNLVLAGLLFLDLEVLRMRLLPLYLLSVLPVIAALVAVLAAALLQKSRAATFLAAAYAGLIVAGAAQVFASLGLFELSETVDEAVYVALVILVVGSSARVGDRFLIIKGERDRARITARKLGAMANSDGLTGLLNRRAFDQNRRLTTGKALLVADIDRFKTINDSFGHQRGDAVLCHAARVIEKVVAEHGGGQVFRLGGEEFAVLFSAGGSDSMEALAEAIRRAIEESADAASAYDMPEITISVGGVMGEGQLMHVAFSDADDALYRAKDGGRNRCEFAAS